MRTLYARASQLERSITFGVVRQLFEPALFSADREDRDRWLAGAAGEDAERAEELEIEVVASAYLSLVARPLLTAELAGITAPTTHGPSRSAPPDDLLAARRHGAEPASTSAELARRTVSSMSLATDVAGLRVAGPR